MGKVGILSVVEGNSIGDTGREQIQIRDLSISYDKDAVASAAPAGPLIAEDRLKDRGEAAGGHVRCESCGERAIRGRGIINVRCELEQAMDGWGVMVRRINHDVQCVAW